MTWLAAIKDAVASLGRMLPQPTPQSDAGSQAGRQALGGAGVFSPTPTAKPNQGVDINKLVQTMVDRLHQSSPIGPQSPQPMGNDYAGRMAASRMNSQMIRLPQATGGTKVNPRPTPSPKPKVTWNKPGTK